MIRPILPAAALAVLLAGCSSAPMHYYTLLSPEPAAADGAHASYQFELLPVGVPAQVDQPQLVIREGGQGVLPLESERWIAPLTEELRGALSADLARSMHTEDVTGLPATGKPRLRVKVDLRRFDSVPGGYALVDAAWSVHALDGGATLACTSRIREPVGPGYDALVQGHQQALGQLAARIAQAAGPLASGAHAACPPDPAAR